MDDEMDFRPGVINVASGSQAWNRARADLAARGKVYPSDPRAASDITHRMAIKSLKRARRRYRLRRWMFWRRQM